MKRKLSTSFKYALRYKQKNGPFCDFDISKDTCAQYGLLSGQVLFTECGRAKVIGVYDNNIWLHIEGDDGATYWDSTVGKFISKRNETLPPFLLPYKTRDGNVLRFDTSQSACSKFGFLSGQRVEVRTTPGTVIGVHSDELWFHMDCHTGASFWEGAKTPQDFEKIGMRHRINETAVPTPVPMFVRTIIIKRSWVCETAFTVPAGVTTVALVSDGTLYYVTKAGPMYKRKDGIVTRAHDGPNKFCAMVWHPIRKTFIACEDGGSFLQELDVNSENPSWVPFAGSGNRGHNDGSLEEAEFSRPNEIAVDKNGDLYIAERHCVRKLFLEAKTVTTIAGSGESTGYRNGEALQARFRNPCGIAVCDDGTFYVSDQFNHCIRKYKDGVVSTVAGIVGVSGHKDGPLDIAELSYSINDITECSDGSLLTSNLEEVRRIDLQANMVTTFSKFAAYILKNPEGEIFFGDRSDPSVDRLMKLKESTWVTVRLLWIGHLKESHEWCPLARLPRELIREIIYIREGFDDIIHEGICKIIT